MPTHHNTLFSNIRKTDPLEFWSNHGPECGRIAEFLDLDKNALSKIGGVSKQSVRLDSRIPKELKERLEQIAVIITMVAGYFEDDQQKTALWFKTPNPSLGGTIPRDMIRLGRYRKLLKFVNEALQANADGDT